MKRKKKRIRYVNVLDLPFTSILDDRPKANQFILMAWDIGGYCGFESCYWDKDNDRCKHAVAWMKLPENHVYSRRCAVTLMKKVMLKPIILKWSHHFSRATNKETYISKDKLPKVAETI